MEGVILTGLFQDLRSSPNSALWVLSMIDESFSKTISLMASECTYYEVYFRRSSVVTARDWCLPKACTTAES